VSADLSLCVVIGYRADTMSIGFDGTKLVDVLPSAVPLFRFVGYDRGVAFGQSLLYSVAAASYAYGGIVAFSNEFCGVYGSHVVLNQGEKLSTPPGHVIAPLPPYVSRILRALGEETEPVMAKVTLPHSPEDEFFYECEAPEDLPRIASYLERPRVLTNLNGSGH
jgi:hypothetical protein